MAKSSIHTVALTGLSKDDRDLMLAMMAGLGSAAQLLLKTSQSLTTVSTKVPVEQRQDWVDASGVLDAEVNAIIDLINACKARLQPEAILRLN